MCVLHCKKMCLGIGNLICSFLRAPACSCTWECLLNPLSPNSDQHQISPCNINAYSTPKVMRIKITQGEYLIFSPLFFHNKSMGTRQDNFFFVLGIKRLNPKIQSLISWFYTYTVLILSMDYTITRVKLFKA